MNNGDHHLLRPRVIGIRVTDDDFELLQSNANAHGKSLSEWCREVLLHTARNPEGNRFVQAMVGEMMALRTIVTELNYYYISRSPLTFDIVKQIWNEAEELKHQQGLKYLRQVSTEKDVLPPQKGSSK